LNEANDATSTGDGSAGADADALGFDCGCVKSRSSLLIVAARFVYWRAFQGNYGCNRPTIGQFPFQGNSKNRKIANILANNHKGCAGLESSPL
jgi:hypothetical protein